MRRFALSVFLPLLIAAVLPPATPAAAQEMPPARVGRVSFVVGQLGFHTVGETKWSQAGVNYPVATGGSFWTDPQSRAEIRIGAQTLSLANNTEIAITRLDEQVMQIALPQGRIELHLRSLAQGNSVEIDTPRGGVWLLEPGIYDIDAGTPDQPSRIAVFEGSAHFVGGATDLAVKSGDVAVITGWEALTATLERAAPDPFAEWCRSRDYRPHRLAAPYYISPAMTGYEELDAYGTWQGAPDFGEVWFPNAVPSGWVPYRDGHWVWIPPWGWTWVDDEPWGFAPFHYGRWALLDGRWGWIPGRFVPQPVYAPALVAFVGDPGGIMLAGMPGPAIGWFPLGPDEIYWPSYTRNPRYIRDVNSGNVGDARIAALANSVGRRSMASPPPQVVNQGFVNRAAATVVPLRAFSNAAGAAQAALDVPPQALRQVPVSLRPPQGAPAAARVAPGLPPRSPGAAMPAMAPGARLPGAPTATTAPGAHPPSGPTAAITPGAHPSGAPTAAIAPGARPPRAPTAAMAPGVHPPGAASASASAMMPVTQPDAAAHAPLPQVMRAPPPATPHPAAAPPPQVMHAAPPAMPNPAAAPPPQVMHAAPPAMPHPAAAPPPQVMRAPPPAMPHPAAAPPPQVMHAAPPAPHPAAAPAAAARGAAGPPPHGGPPGAEKKD